MKRYPFGSLDLQAQTRALNLVYEDYSLQFAVSAEWVSEHLRAHQICLERSPLWIDSRGVVALALVGFRPGRAWIGGFGIARRCRGQRLSLPLLRECLEATGPVRVQLEVLTQNQRAQATYLRGGFRVERQLAVMEGPGGPPGQQLPAQGEPCWQRQKESLEGMEGLECQPPDLHYRGTQLFRVGEGSRWGQLSRFRHLRLSNEPVGSDLHGWLVGQGWKEVARQYEMVREGP